MGWSWRTGEFRYVGTYFDSPVAGYILAIFLADRAWLFGTINRLSRQGGRIGKEMAPADIAGCIHGNQHGCVKRSSKKYRAEEDDIW